MINKDVEIKCKQCCGTGEDLKLNCRNASSECCGGCYDTIPCDECKGTGDVIVDIEDEFHELIVNMNKAIVKLRNELEYRGCGVTESIKIVKKLQKII